MQKTFASFARENPFDLTADQLAQLKHDLAHPDAETASDELVDFTLGRSGLPSRQRVLRNTLRRSSLCAAILICWKSAAGAGQGRLCFLPQKVIR